MRIFLETERLILRQFTEADLENLVELDSDPEVMRFLTGGEPTPREQIQQETLPRLLSYYQRCSGYGYWAAVEQTTGEFLGWFFLRPAQESPAGEVELGYRLRKLAWGRGLATEGARALIRKGFTELDVERIFAQTMAVNAASRRVMEKVGLTLVRTFYPTWLEPIAGGEQGEVEYALLRT